MTVRERGFQERRLLARARFPRPRRLALVEAAEPKAASSPGGLQGVCAREVVELEGGVSFSPAVPKWPCMANCPRLESFGIAEVLAVERRRVKRLRIIDCVRILVETCCLLEKLGSEGDFERAFVFFSGEMGMLSLRGRRGWQENC